jgi:hypothetical protein
MRAQILGIVAALGLLLCSSITATSSLFFQQEALTRGLDRLREVAAASAIPFDTTTTNLPYGTFFGDLDGDGRLDVYAVNHGQFPHRSGLWTNAGAGGFNPNIFTVSLTSSSGAYFGDTGWMYDPIDLNGDGKPDLYFGGWYAYAIVCYNRGVSSAGGWTGPRFDCRQSVYPLSYADVNRDRPGAYPLPFADVNGDGRPDVLTYQDPSAFDNYLSVLRLLPTSWRLNNGSEDTATWPAAASEFDLVNTAPAGALLDLNGDGLPDKIQGIPVASSQRGPYGIGSGGTQVYFGQSNRTYALQQATGLEGVTSPIAALEDVNRDGCLDVGFDDTFYRDNQYWYLQDRLSDGHCAGTWHLVGRTSPELPHFLGAWRQSLDLDNSGTLLDVVLVKSGYGNTGGYSGGVHVFQQQAGAWTEILNHGINLFDTYYSGLRVGDWNDDGLPDIVAQGSTVMPDTDNGIALFTNQTFTTNTWVKVQLPGLSGPFAGTARIELFESGQAGNSAAKVGQPIALTTGYHWPSTWYHLGAGARTAVDVRVTFPDGHIVVVTTATNQRVSIGSAAPGNTPPTVNAGQDQTITLPNSASLHGVVSDDGLPNPPGTVTVSWSVVSGPGTVNFSAPTSLDTTASVSAAGSYTLRLTASDGAAAAHDDLVLTVQPAGDTTPPTVALTAPTDGATVTRKTTVTLTATASDSGGVASVSFYVNGALKCTDTTAPYSCAWPVPAAAAKTYQLQARATDAAGNIGASAVATVTVK